jgi:hypothetical protein
MNGKRPYHGRNRKEMKMDILSHQVQIKENAVPKGWSKESAYFVNELLQRKVEKRLGLKGISELKEHEWMKEFNWKGVNNKKVSSPFEPYRGCDNYNKKYVESDDKIGEETKERYLHYKNDKEYESLFDNYTFNCIPKEEIIKYLKKKKKNTLNIKGKTFKKIVAKDNKGFKSDRDIRRDNTSLERVNLDSGKDLLKMFPGTMTTQKIMFNNNNNNPHIQSGFMLRINNNNNVIQSDRGGNVSKGISPGHLAMPIEINAHNRIYVSHVTKESPIYTFCIKQTKVYLKDTLYHYNKATNHFYPAYTTNFPHDECNLVFSTESPLHYYTTYQRYKKGQLIAPQNLETSRLVQVEKKTGKARYIRLVNDYLGGLEVSGVNFRYSMKDNYVYFRFNDALKLKEQLKEVLKTNTSMDNSIRERITHLKNSLHEDSNDVIVLCTFKEE